MTPLASDPNVQRYAGTLQTVVDLAADYAFTDVDGSGISTKWQGYFEKARTE